MKWIIGALLGVMLFPYSMITANPLEATTIEGKKVVLFPDGTWRYKESDLIAGSGSTPFTSPSEATTGLRSKKGFFELWINPNKWRMQETSDNPDAEFYLSHASGDAYAMVIAERISMPISSLKNLALANAKKAGPDAEVVFQEERVVNGTKVHHMRIDVTMQGISFSFYGYYWTGQAGSLQVVAFTGRSLLEEFKEEFANLLAGLIVTNP
jgi:hypothetical protein